jgi:hypothetical protein
MTRPINVHRHFPVDSRTCVCGDTFRKPETFENHMRVFSGNWANGPRWTPTKNGGKTALFYGHRMHFQRGVGLNPRMNKVTCFCGWSRYTSSLYVTPYGREHARGVIRSIIHQDWDEQGARE